MTLSAIIISKSPIVESRLILSLSFADEILIIYSEGKEISSKKESVRYLKHNFVNFADQRNFGLSMAKNDWVFFVDTDEIVSKQLATEIKNTLLNSSLDAYLIPRRDIVFHQVLLYGETGEIKILRLAKRNSGQFVRDVHEQWQINGKIGELFNPLYHQKDHFISEFLDRINLYGQFDANNLTSEGKPFSYFRLIIYPKAKFILNYLLKKGYFDGLPGLFQAYLMSIQSLSVRVFQWEKRQS